MASENQAWFTEASGGHSEAYRGLLSRSLDQESLWRLYEVIGLLEWLLFLAPSQCKGEQEGPDRDTLCLGSQPTFWKVLD